MALTGATSRIRTVVNWPMVAGSTACSHHNHHARGGQSATSVDRAVLATTSAWRRTSTYRPKNAMSEHPCLMIHHTVTSMASA